LKAALNCGIFPPSRQFFRLLRGEELLMAAMALPFCDAQLVERAVRGDRKAFDQLAQACCAPLLQYCLSYLRDYDLADEAAQLTLIQLHRKLQTLKEPQAFPSWMQRIARNQCIDLLRSAAAARTHEQRVTETDPPSGYPAVADAFTEQRANHQFVQLLSGLSKKLRDTLLFFYVYGHPVEYIGDYLNVPPETVRKRLFDARRALGRQLAGGQEEAGSLLADLGRLRSAPLHNALTALDTNPNSFALFAEGFEQGAVDTRVWTPVAGIPQVSDQCATLIPSPTISYTSPALQVA
jgi:RNA polymerase sigma-70 factor (ECF subfamily)